MASFNHTLLSFFNKTLMSELLFPISKIGF